MLWCLVPGSWRWMKGAQCTVLQRVILSRRWIHLLVACCAVSGEFRLFFSSSEFRSNHWFCLFQDFIFVRHTHDFEAFSSSLDAGPASGIAMEHDSCCCSGHQCSYSCGCDE